MKVERLVEELYNLVDTAKAVPLSSSCMVNREQFLGIISEINQLLPKELNQAATLLEEREAVVADAKSKADRIVQLAEAEAKQLVSQERVYKEALAEADTLRDATNEELARMRRELDDYVDAKLGAFEAALTRTLQQVQAGRDRVNVRLVGELSNIEDPEHPGSFFGDWENPRP
ncbi:MAG: hypothetical protein RL038_609 [Actinomycetota bacterium]